MKTNLSKPILWLLFAALCSVSIFTVGCAGLDRYFLKRDTEAPYIDNITQEPTTEKTDAKGRPNEENYTTAPSDELELGGKIGSTFAGPWGPVIGFLPGLLASVYSLFRGKKKVNLEKAKTEVVSEGMKFLVLVLEDLKNGVIDGDKNGKITKEEIANYIRFRGKEAASPAFVAEVVRIVTSSMTDVEKDKAMKAAVTKATV